MPPGPVIAGPAWSEPPDRMPREKKIIAATNRTPATMPTEAATRLSPLRRCPCGDIGARPPTTRHILCRARRDFRGRPTGNVAQVSKVVNDDALLSAGPGLSP